MNIRELMLAQQAIADGWAEQARYNLACGDTERSTDCAKFALSATETAIGYYFQMPKQEQDGLMVTLHTLHLSAATMALWSGDAKKAGTYARMGIDLKAGKDITGALLRVLELADGFEAQAQTKAPTPKAKPAAQPRTTQEERDDQYAQQGFTKVTGMATGEYMPGIPDPRVAQPVAPLMSQHQRSADTYLKEAGNAGLDNKAWIAFYNHLADLTGFTAVIDVSDTDIELNQVRSAALKLLKMGIANTAALNDLVKAWKGENSWRKGGVTPAMLVEYQSKVVTAAKLAQESKPDGQNDLLDVEMALKMPDGEVIWNPYRMTRKAMEERMALGYNLRIAQGGK